MQNKKTKHENEVLVIEVKDIDDRDCVYEHLIGVSYQMTRDSFSNWFRDLNWKCF